MGYDGFISYSHAADGKFAPALQDGLQKLAKPWYRRRALDIFRDNTGLSANPGLWTSITSSMDDSRYFVLLASPEAVQSQWVNREIEHWKANQDVARLLPVLTDGEWVWDEDANDFDWDASTAVPAALAGVFTEEPRHLDMRWARSETDLDLRNSRFRDQVAELAAPMHGMAKDELEGADIRAHRRARRLAAAAIILLFLLTLSSGAAALLAKRNADEARLNEARAVAAQTEADDNAAEAEANAEVADANADEAERQRTEAQANAEEARENAEEADEQRGQAEANAAEADEQRGQAESNAAEAEANAAEAEANAAEADEQRGQAETNAAEAEAQRAQAEANAAEAEAQRAQAESNAQQAADNAREADEQRAQALAFAADADRERAEAEAQRLLAEQNAAEAQRQQQRAERNAQEAQEQTELAEARADALNAEQLAAQALLEKDGHLDRALLLAIEAARIGGAEHLAANNALLEVIQEANGVEQFLPIPSGIDGSRDFLAVAVTPDGSAVAASDGHDIIIWRFSGTDLVGTQIIDPGVELISSLEFPRPDRLIGITSTNFGLLGIGLWDAVSGARMGHWGNVNGDGLTDADSVLYQVTPDGQYIVIQEYDKIYLNGLGMPWAQVVDLNAGTVGAWWHGVFKRSFSADGSHVMFTDWFSGQHTTWNLADDQHTTLYGWSSPSPEFDSAGATIWGLASGYFVRYTPDGDLLDFYPLGFFDLADGSYNAATQTLALLEVVDDQTTSPPEAILWVFDGTDGTYLNGRYVDPCSSLVDSSPQGVWFYTTARSSALNDSVNYDPYCWQSQGARSASEIFYAPDGGYWGKLDGTNQADCRRGSLFSYCYDTGAFFQNDRFVLQAVEIQDGDNIATRLTMFDLFVGQGGSMIWANQATNVDATWSDDRTFVATASDGSNPAQIWRFDGSGDGLPDPLEGSLSVREVEFSGSRLFGVGTDNVALVWDAQANRSAQDVDAFTGFGPDDWATLDPQGTTLAYAQGDGVIRLRDLATGTEQDLATLGAGEALYHDAPFGLFGVDTYNPIFYTQDGSHLVVNVVTALDERQARIYDVTTSQLVGTLPYPAMASSADGGTLVGWDFYAPLPCDTCPIDNLIHLHRTSDLALLQTIFTEDLYPETLFAAAAPSPDGSLLATSGRGGEIVIWDVATGTVITEVNTYGASDAPLGEQQLAWSPNGDRLLYVAGNSLNDDVENYHLWETSSWELRARVDLPRADFDSLVDGVRFAPDGTRIVTPQGYVLDGFDLRPLGGNLVPTPDLAGYVATPENAEIAFRSNSEIVMLSRHAGPGSNLYQITVFGIEADAVLGCELASRNLTQLEWTRYFGSEAYRSTCSQYSPGS